MAAFKVDENLPAEVLDLLRGARHDASSVKEEGLCGAPDDVVARVCRDERRTLVTLDLGFGDIRRYPPPLHPGIVVLRLAAATGGAWWSHCDVPSINARANRS